MSINNKPMYNMQQVSLPKTITASVMVTYTVCDVRRDIAEDRGVREERVSMREIIDYVTETSYETLSHKAGRLVLTDEYGQTIKAKV